MFEVPSRYRHHALTVFSAAGPEKVEIEDLTENVLTVDQSVQAGNTAQQQGVYTNCRCMLATSV